jgi:hypothetical protein
MVSGLTPTSAATCACMKPWARSWAARNCRCSSRVVGLATASQDGSCSHCKPVCLKQEELPIKLRDVRDAQTRPLPAGAVSCSSVRGQPSRLSVGAARVASSALGVCLRFFHPCRPSLACRWRPVSYLKRVALARKPWPASKTSGRWPVVRLRPAFHPDRE